jgi:hypothetical protein
MDAETMRQVALVLGLWTFVLAADAFWRAGGKLKPQEVRYRR